VLERTLASTILRPSFAQASPPLRLATAMAGFAEKLRGSYWARGIRYDELLARLDGLGPVLGDRDEVTELRRLMILARDLDHRDDRFEGDSPISSMAFDEVPILR
jgi:Ca-activated chloride channel family protein